MPDFFNKDASILKEKKLWILDLDGTVYNEDTVFPCTVPFLDAVTHMGGRYVFATNNSSRSSAEYVRKLTGMGIKVDDSSVFTSTQIAAIYLEKNHPGKRVYCQGTRSFVDELRALGIDAVTEPDGAEAVLVGFDTELTMEKLRKTCKLLTEKDIPYIATNPDLVCPVSFGFVPDCGSMCQGIKNATGKEPVFLGKPEPTLLELIIERLGFDKQESVFVGDRLYTDIRAGNNCGITTVCVLSGESDAEMVKKSKYTPTFTFGSVHDIKTILES